MADRVLTSEIVSSQPFQDQVAEIVNNVTDTIAGQFTNDLDRRDVRAFVISYLIADQVRLYPDRVPALANLVEGSFTPGFLEN